MSEEISVALIGFSGVVIGALLTPIVEAVKSWYSTRRHAQYLAVRVVCILDQFIDTCAEVIGDYGEEDEHGIYRYSALPDAPSFPDDLDWRSIDNKLMYEILTLPNKVDYAKKKIWHFGEVTGPPYDEVGTEREYEFSILGLSTIDLKDRLSKAYGIPSKPRTTGWDALEYFTERKNKIDAWRKEREKRNTEMWAEFKTHTSSGGNTT